MYLTASGDVPPRLTGNDKRTFTCAHCSKVFVTKHGLQQHQRRYHDAIQAGDNLPPDIVDAHCLIQQATETGDIVTLLENEAVVSLLSTECLICHHKFGRKQELLRHLRSQHTSLWTNGMTDALLMESQRHTQCYCRPAVPHRKHTCIPFLQFAMLRTWATDTPDDDRTRTLTPDMLLTTEEVLHQLLWLGHLPLLALRPVLKKSLSLQCMICSTRYNSPALLHRHLTALHGPAVQECQAWLGLLNWWLFASFGCVWVHFAE